jgi:hypothetical protein
MVAVSAHGHTDMLTVEQARCRITEARGSDDREQQTLAAELAVAVARLTLAGVL